MAGTKSVKLGPDLEERLEKVAGRRDRSSHWVMKRAIEEFVERDEEEAAFNKRAQESWEHYQRTGLHLTNEEVMDWLDRRIRGEDVPLPKAHI